MNTASVKGEYETISFAFMNIGATHMLELAEASEEGQLYNSASCIIFSAFTLEAYFNHLGAQLYDNWVKKERKLSKLKKYKLFCSEFNITPNFEEKPYSSIPALFSFRDTMAHGKSSKDAINKEIELDLDNLTHFTVGAPWVEFSTVENAKILHADMQKIIRELNLAAGHKRDPFMSMGSGLLALSL
ncbi:hypothetical protein GNP89_19910 [Aliivibrio fischeri]|nr:hypothetical protein [Aliivibrio fischeri]